MNKRSRFKQSTTFQERLAAFATKAREKAALLPPGPKRDEVLAKLRQADAASSYDVLFSSGGMATDAHDR